MSVLRAYRFCGNLRGTPEEDVSVPAGEKGRKEKVCPVRGDAVREAASCFCAGAGLSVLRSYRVARRKQVRPWSEEVRACAEYVFLTAPVAHEHQPALRKHLRLLPLPLVRRLVYAGSGTTILPCDAPTGAALRRRRT